MDAEESDDTLNRTGRRARDIVAGLTGDEKLWCLDGDAPPFWAGLAYLAESGYHRARSWPPGWSGSGCRASRSPTVHEGWSSTRPRVSRSSMARGATWDIDLEERIGAAIGEELRAVGRRSLRWGVRQRPPPPSVGAGPGDLRGGPRTTSVSWVPPSPGVCSAMPWPASSTWPATRWRMPASPWTSPSTRSPSTRCISLSSSASSTRAWPR